MCKQVFLYSKEGCAIYQFADFHCDTLLKVSKGLVDFSCSQEKGHLDLNRLLATNYVFQCFAAFFEPSLGQEAALRHTLRLLNIAREKILTLPQVQWVKRAEDLDGGGDKLLALLSIEGADFIGSDLYLIELVHTMGVRLITLTWNGRNSLGDGVKVGGGGGLTKLGTKAVNVMQDINIIVDVSHLGERGFWDVASAAEKPFVASHSNAWALCQHPRNLKDEQIREISSHGGLIGVNLCPAFIAQSREGQTLDALVRHISHIAEVGGVDCLCLGADLDGIEELPIDMVDVKDMGQLPGLLEDVGFSSIEIQAVCAANLIRFLRNNLE